MKNHKGFATPAIARPRDVEAILQRCRNLEELKRIDEAIMLVKHWLALNKSQGFAEEPKKVWRYLASLYFRSERWGLAINSLTTANKSIQISQKLIDCLAESGAAAAIRQDYTGSAEIHCKLLSLQPNHAKGLRNFSIVLKRLGSASEAKVYIERYLRFEPKCPDGLNTYGTILSMLGQHSDAIITFKNGLEIAPNHPELNCNIANEHHLRAEIDLAYIYASRSVFFSPGNLGLWIDQLTHLRRVCGFDELTEINWFSLISKVPSEQVSQSYLQFLVLAESAEEQLHFRRLISDWGDNQAKLTGRHPFPMPRKYIPDSPIKIGFISGDFRDHSVARFIWPLFRNLDPNQFSLYGYSTFKSNDHWRRRFENQATAIRDIESSSDIDACNIIHGDEIDVLFDLTGFTKGARTAIFLRRPAPIQISWLGFPGTSGIRQIDYLFLDRYLMPADPSLIREKPLISPGTTVCFSQIDEVPITPEIPELVRGHLTLGTLNNSYKLTRATIARWCRVLQALPSAQFLFVRREFQSYILRANLLAEFERNGISSERIHFFNNRLAGRHYLDCYNEIDFTLDTFPVTGGTTTTDALWMGVPVVGLEGPNVHQRVCSAILHHAGHPEWIARSDDEFLQIALDLAADQERRIALRQSLRDELKASLLCNTRQFAADFAATMESLRPAS